MKRFLLVTVFLLLSVTIPLKAQFYSAGNDPASARFLQIRTDNFRILYPKGTDSLARLYAEGLERHFHELGNSIGCTPCQFNRKPMPVILHPYTAYGNGMVMWAPRRMELYTLGEPYNPDPLPWIQNLTIHESRHASQLQLGRRGLFKWTHFLTGELSDVAAWAMYPDIAFAEGDAVVAETGLSAFGRGRNNDFLEFIRVSLDNGDKRDFYRWRYSSIKYMTPDHYRAGYMLIAGLRTSWDKPLFTKEYYENVFSRTLPAPFFNLQYTTKRISGENVKGSFSLICDDFQKVWNENDSLRTPFSETEAFSERTRRFSEFKAATLTNDGIYAVRTGLEHSPSLVRIDGDGKVRRISAFSSTTSDLRYSDRLNRIYWSEYRPDLRWGLKSTSVIRSLDLDTGRKSTLVSGARFYSPAPSEDGGRLAFIQYPQDGSTVILISDCDGRVLSRQKAPDGIQVYECAWMGERLFVCAICSEGAGIFEASDNFKTVLPGSPAKIRELRSRDGKLYFVCDRNGVNELYSYDGSRLAQESSLRHGAREFLFDASGEFLLCAELSPDGRGFRKLPVSELKDSSCVWSEVWKNPIAEKLSAQERELAASSPDTITTVRISEPERYVKAGHLLRFHTWLPLYFNYDAVENLSFSTLYNAATLGAMAFFQNDLSSASGLIGYSAYRTGGEGWNHKLDLRFKYTGLYPVIESKLLLNSGNASAYGFRIRQAIDGKTTYSVRQVSRNTPSATFSTRIYVPLNFSSGGWNRGLVPQLSYSISNSSYDNSVLKLKGYGIIEELDCSEMPVRFIAGKTVWLQDLSASVRGYTMLPKAKSGVFPRWGIGAEVGAGFRPGLTSIYSPSMYGYLYSYLPGIIPEHGLKLSALVQKHLSYGKTYIQEQRVVTTPRGYSTVSGSLGRYLALRYPLQAKVSADYLMAVLPVDWSGLGPVAYVRNFELGGHYDQSFFSSAKANASLSSLGLNLNVCLGNFLWIPFDTKLGVSWSYNCGRSYGSIRESGVPLERHYFGMLFSIDY